MSNTVDLGQVAYDAYCETRNWKSFSGQALPRWPDVQPDIQEGWRVAAKAVVAAAQPDTSEPG
jgi:hypothetical protein